MIPRKVTLLNVAGDVMTDVLIVSNQFSSRIAYTAALNGYGYSVVETQSINEAELLMRDGMRPRLIILDIKFTPSLRDAFNEFEALYADDTSRPALMIISGSENAQMAEAYADVFLPRPAELHDVITSVQNCLN
jgi:DNA-binding NtrC family response regulator